MQQPPVDDVTPEDTEAIERNFQAQVTFHKELAAQELEAFNAISGPEFEHGLQQVLQVTESVSAFMERLIQNSEASDAISDQEYSQALQALGDGLESLEKLIQTSKNAQLKRDEIFQKHIANLPESIKTANDKFFKALDKAHRKAEKKSRRGKIAQWFQWCPFRRVVLSDLFMTSVVVSSASWTGFVPFASLSWSIACCSST